MSEPRVRYEDDFNCICLQREIELLEAQLHCDIRKYGIDMSDELLADLKDLEKKCKAVRKQMDTARNS